MQQAKKSDIISPFFVAFCLEAGPAIYTRREGGTGRREVAASQQIRHPKTVFLYSFLFGGPAS